MDRMKLPLSIPTRQPSWAGFYLIWAVAFAICVAFSAAPDGTEAVYQAANPTGAGHVSSPGQRPELVRTSFAAVTPAPAPGTVWVNTRSHVYHYPGQRWYGHTLEGKYMKKEDAIAEGDRATKNGQ